MNTAGEVVLTTDGWEVRITGEPALPVHVDLAYEATGYNQTVLDETRKLCGVLRSRPKHDHETATILQDLRAGLERARAMKARREETT